MRLINVYQNAELNVICVRRFVNRVNSNPGKKGKTDRERLHSSRSATAVGDNENSFMLSLHKNHYYLRHSQNENDEGT